MTVETLNAQNAMSAVRRGSQAKAANSSAANGG